MMRSHFLIANELVESKADCPFSPPAFCQEIPSCFRHKKTFHANFIIHETVFLKGDSLELVAQEF